MSESVSESVNLWSIEVLTHLKRILIQNQWGTPKVAKICIRSGLLLEGGDFDKYKVDG